MLGLGFPTSVSPEGRFVVIFTAYLDESGTHGDGEWVAVAGWLSTPERWAEFEREWLTALSDFGISRFHMVEFAHRKGEFASWSEDERRANFARLAANLPTAKLCATPPRSRMIWLRILVH
jgi:hypothetical protein